MTLSDAGIHMRGMVLRREAKLCTCELHKSKAYVQHFIPVSQAGVKLGNVRIHDRDENMSRQ